MLARPGALVLLALVLWAAMASRAARLANAIVDSFDSKGALRVQRTGRVVQQGSIDAASIVSGNFTSMVCLLLPDSQWG